MSDQDPDNSDNPETLYKAMPPVSPPAELDRAILQHAATRTPAQKAGFRWETIGRRFAAAAVLVLAVGIYFQADFTEEARTQESVAPQDAVEKRERTTPSEPAPASPQTSKARLKANVETAARAEVRQTQNQPTPDAVAAAPELEEDFAGAFADIGRGGQVAVMEQSYDTAIFQLEACQTGEQCSYRLKHAECDRPYKIPLTARNLSSEGAVFLYRVDTGDHFVRCLEGTWTAQSQAADQQTR